MASIDDILEENPEYIAEHEYDEPGQTEDAANASTDPDGYDDTKVLDTEGIESEDIDSDEYDEEDIDSDDADSDDEADDDYEDERPARASRGKKPQRTTDRFMKWLSGIFKSEEDSPWIFRRRTIALVAGLVLVLIVFLIMIVMIIKYLPCKD